MVWWIEPFLALQIHTHLTPKCPIQCCVGHFHFYPSFSIPLPNFKSSRLQHWINGDLKFEGIIGPGGQQTIFSDPPKVLMGGSTRQLLCPWRTDAKHDLYR